MTTGDVTHFVLLVMGLCAGLSIGSHHGLSGTLVGGISGLFGGHLLAIVLTVGDLVVHGLDRWRTFRRRHKY